MKVSTHSSTTNGCLQIVPIVPLQRPANKDLTKGDYATLECITCPGVADSASYELVIPYFKSGTPEEFLKWKRNVEKAISGQGATDGLSKYTLTHRLLDGDNLTAFNLKTQKRFMRRFPRKPSALCTDYLD